MKSASRFALGLALVLAACGGGTRTGDGGDAAVVNCPDGAANFCLGNSAYHCDGTGHGVLDQTCMGSTAACVPGVGCRVCQGATFRCDPSNGNTPQQCRADNGAWVSQTPCGGNQTCTGGMCLSPCEAAAAAHSYLGCEYWPVTLKNTCMGELGGTFPFAIAIANPQTTPVTAMVTGGALTAPMMQTIAPGALQTIELPYVDDIAQLRVRPGMSVLHVGGAYHVVTSAPVTAYQFNPLTFQSPDMMFYSYSNDASLLLPTPVLGTAYTVLTWPGLTFQIGMSLPWESGDTITVVGTRSAPTMVTVNLTGATFAGTGVTAATAGQSQTYMLGAGDALQILSHGMGTDLTGSTIQSSAPVAVYPGHGCAQVPLDRAAGDHLEEQLFPDTAWGHRYAVTAFADGRGLASTIRIIARQDGTHVTLDPSSVNPSIMALAAHQFVQFDATTDFVVTSDRPVLIAQFMYGEGLDGTVGDPAMVYEIPTEQYRMEYTFLTPATFTHSYVNLVCTTGQTPLLDGAAPVATPHPIGGSNLSVWALEVMPGVHTARSTGSDGCGVKVYGTAPFTAYAYPGGLDLNVIVPQ